MMRTYFRFSVSALLVFVSVAIIWSCSNQDDELISANYHNNENSTKDNVTVGDVLSYKVSGENVVFHNPQSLFDGINASYTYRTSDNTKINVLVQKNGGTLTVTTSQPISCTCEDGAAYSADILTDGLIQSSNAGVVEVEHDASTTTKKWFISLGNGGSISPSPIEMNSTKSFSFTCDCETNDPTASTSSLTATIKECSVSAPMSGQGEIKCVNNSCASGCGCKLRAWMTVDSGTSNTYTYGGNGGLFVEASTLVFNGTTF